MEEKKQTAVYINKTYLAIVILSIFILLQLGLIIFFRTRQQPTPTITPQTDKTKTSSPQNANAPLPLLHANIHSSAVHYTISGKVKEFGNRISIDSGSLNTPQLPITKDTQYFVMRPNTKLPGVNDAIATTKNRIRVGDSVYLTIVYFPSSSSWVVTRVSKQ